MANKTTQIAAGKPQAPNRIIFRRPLAAAAGKMPMGGLVGRNSAGYFVKADDAAALTEIGVQVSPTITPDSADSDGATKIDVEYGIVLPVKIATLSTDAAARAQYGQPAYVLYNDEVRLTRTTYENKLGNIVGHNSVTEVMVEIPLAGCVSGQSALDFSRFTPGAQTDGSMMTTGNNWIAFSTPSARGFKALLSYTAASGDFNAWCLRARSNSAMPVVCVNAEASSGQNDHGDLYGVQGFATANHTQSVADNICCALYGRIARPAGMTSVGRDWVLWVDTHMAVKASGGSYLARFSHNGLVAADGLFTIYIGGRLDYFINFEDISGFCSTQAGGTPTITHKLACYIGGAVRYITLNTIA